jgi:hypothetical protein
MSIKINNPKTENQNSKTNPINHPAIPEKSTPISYPFRQTTTPTQTNYKDTSQSINNTQKTHKSSSPNSSQSFVRKTQIFRKKLNHHKIFPKLAMIKPTTKIQLQSPTIIPLTNRPHNPNHTPKFSSNVKQLKMKNQKSCWGGEYVRLPEFWNGARGTSTAPSYIQ